MTIYDFPRDSYSDITAQKRVVSDIISIIDPNDTPLVAFLGGLSGSMPTGWNIQNQGKKIEWLERDLMPLSGAMGATIASATTATSATVADASVFKVGNVIQVDSEFMRVTARDTDANTLTVVRAFGGSTNATHASDATIEIISDAREEGDDSDAAGFTDVEAPYNLTQIFHTEVKVSGTEQAIDYYGVGDPLMYEKNLKVQEVMRLVERALLRQSIRVDSGKVRVAGGLPYFINSSGGNTVTAGALTHAKFETVMRNIEDDGGMPSVAVVSPMNHSRITNLYNNSTYLRIDRGEDTVGMNLTAVETTNGTLTLLKTRHATDDTIFILDPSHVALYALRPFFWEELAKTGDADKEELIGELTFLVRHGLEAHGAITSITA